MSESFLFLFWLTQADFPEDNIGSTNMKGFLTALQRKGKVHHAILVEQVTLASSCGLLWLGKLCA